MIEARKTDPWDPEPSAARLAPWGFSAGGVDSLGEGFFLKLISELMYTRWVGFGLLNCCLFFIKDPVN